MKHKILNYNPIDRNDQIRKGNDIELFYVINIEGIKKDTYILSNYGRLFNMTTGVELMMTKRPSGYIVANLKSDDNKNKNIYPHRIIANIFIPKTKEDIEEKRNYILFIDGDKDNLSYTNMKWVSLKTIRSLANYTKETNKLCTLTIDQVHTICEYLEKGMRIKEIQNILPFNTTYSIISNIAYKRSWLNISSLYDINYSKNKHSKSA